MKTEYRILSALLLLSLTLTFAACGGSSTGGDAGVTDTTAAETVTEEVTTAPEYVPPAQGFGGADAEYGMLQQLNPNWIIRTYIEGFAEAQNGDLINDAIYNRNILVEEALDCNIVPRIYNDINVMVNSTMAGDKYADVVTLAGVAIRSVLAKNILYDLNSIDTLQLDASWWDQNSVEALSIANTLYAAVGNISSFSFVGSYAVFVNKGILESYSLDSPYDAVREGSWTFDLMGEMARKVAHDLNGDGVTGKDDMFGLSSEALGMVFLNAAGIRFTEKDGDDIPEISLGKYDVTGALEKIVPLMRDPVAALYSSDHAGGYKNVFRELIVEKFIADELLFINNWVLVALELRNMESDFGILPPPKGSEAQEEYIDYGSETWVNYCIIPLTVSDPDRAGQFADALGYFGKTEIYTALIDTTITDKALRDTDTEEMLDIIYNNRRYDLAGIFDWGGINSFAGSFISNKSTDFASAWASKEAGVKAALDKTVETILG